MRKEKDIYYRSIYLFIKRVKDIILTKKEKLIYINLNTYLRDSILI